MPMIFVGPVSTVLATDGYDRQPMSTRKLILLALACGLAILAAAAAQLFLATR